MFFLTYISIYLPILHKTSQLSRFVFVDSIFDIFTVLCFELVASNSASDSLERLVSKINVLFYAEWEWDVKLLT